MENVEKLINLLELEKIEENLFRGNNYQAPWKRVFGGQVLSQALYAAQQTVPEDRCAHSMHGYFILPGDISQPIIYDVERTRDGGSFTTRRVRAIQKGQAIFSMSCSFQKEQEGYEHQVPMPQVPPPDDLLPDYEQAQTWEATVPEFYRQILVDRPIEFRPVEQFNPFNTTNQKPQRYIWLKAKGQVSASKILHQAILAYASDYNLLATALLPHLGDVSPFDMQMATLDHGMWFHQDFDVNGWLLYALDSPSASNTRGFTRGNIFTQEGKLIASVVQEGLIRKRRKKE